MSQTTIPFFHHDLGQEELDAIAEVLQGAILTTGETVKLFERRFADYLGVKHALGVTSCTGALHLSLLALGIGPGDEVITTPMTFIATATAILEAGAKPVFVDVEEHTGLIDPARIPEAITPRTKAIMPVHLYGQMCDMNALRQIADEHGLAIVEDAAHCIEGERDGVKPGQLGDTACFSFYATKNITCGEGGMLVVNDDHLAEQLPLLRLHGMTKTAADRAKEGYQHWDMTVLGWKYNMDNIQAAMLLSQLDRIERNLEKRVALAESYKELLSEVPGIEIPHIHENVKHAYHLFPIWIQNGLRDEVILKLQERNIGVVVNYRSIHLLKYFQDTMDHTVGSFPNAERIGDATLSLPFYPNMPLCHVEWTAKALQEILKTRSLAA